MNQEELITYQTFATIQSNLINLELALSSSTTNRFMAIKHIKQSLLLAEKIATQPEHQEILQEIKEISQSLLVKCRKPSPTSRGLYR